MKTIPPALPTHSHLYPPNIAPTLVRYSGYIQEGWTKENTDLWKGSMGSCASLSNDTFVETDFLQRCLGRVGFFFFLYMYFSMY